MIAGLEILDSDTGLPVLVRALHVLAGITWIGLLYYFNVVQVPAFAAYGDEARARNVSIEQLANYAEEAFNFQRWAWEQHFLFMYPLLGTYFALRGLCEQLGVDTDLVSKFLQGNDTKIMETDRQLWALVDLARRHKIDDLVRGQVSIDALRAELDDAVVLTGRGDGEFAFAGIVAGGLFAIDVLAG